MSDFEILRRLAVVAAMSEDEVHQARNARDFSENEFSAHEARRPAQQGPLLTDDEVRALVSDEARLKVIEFEVTSERVYRRKYERPILPGVSSGITIGIGYDLGYNDPPSITSDLDGLLPISDIEALARVCRLTGTTARPRLNEVQHIRVPWEAAIEIYGRATLPKFGRSVVATFPNAAELKGHCFGALLSLVYNRGPDLVGKPSDGGRRREMKAIHDLMRERRWSEIPAQIRSMKRIWNNDPNAAGVIKRREAEALLFERGLELMNSSTVGANSHLEGTHESRTAADLATLEGDGYHYRELDESTQILERTADPNWKKVVWPPYECAPDYSHIPDRSLLNTTFQFGPKELELLIEANAFKPSREHGRIMFALRGAQLVQALDRPQPMDRQENRETLTLVEGQPDHNTFRCVVGTYDTERGRMNAYMASTVPNAKAVASYVAGGDPSNMMLTGCYQFQVGWHQESRADKKIPGCLIESGRRKAVLRTKNDHTYELTDIVQDALPGDNVHPGKSEGPFPFSSWGCLVLKGSVTPVFGGDRANVTHTGEWARFRKSLGLPDQGTGGHQRKYDLVLLTGLDGAIAADAIRRQQDPASEAVRRQLYRLRQGSVGWRVGLLQRGLGMPASDRLDAATAAKLAEKQRSISGEVHGLYTPAMDETLGFGVFSTPAPMARLERRLESAGSQATTTDERDRLAFELGMEYEASRGSRRHDESNHHEGLRSAIVALGTQALVTTGNVLIREAEAALRGYICERDGVGRHIDRDDIRQRVDDAAKTGTGALKYVLVSVLRQASFNFASHDTLEWLVGYVLDEIIVPQTGGAGTAVVQRIDGGVAWLCGEWSKRIDTVYGTPVTTTVQAPAPTTTPVNPSTPAATFTLTDLPPRAAAPPTAASRILSLLKTAADGANPDVAGVRTYVHQLRDCLRQGGGPLTPDENQQVLDVLCDSRFMEQIAGAVGRDPYVMMADIEQALNTSPIDKATVEHRVTALCDVLADARIKLQSDRVEVTLKELRNKRMPYQVSRLADRVLTRSPDLELLGRISPLYGLALIDSQRIVAGIEVLHGALERGQLTAAGTAEVYGNLGRAHKQIYVNHIKSPSEALALQETLGQQLARSVDCYGRIYDPSRPGDRYWHGINLIALLKRAQTDRVPVPGRSDPDLLARGIIAALEPMAPGTKDHYLLATLGEAYLALGDVGNAARYYAAFSDHLGTDTFSLNSAVRQLEEVWRLEAGKEGAGGILIGLKAVLAQKEGGRITLSPTEQKAIASATSAQHQEHFESRTKGGKFVPLAYLQRIVSTGMAVAAIKQKPTTSGHHQPGAGDTVGTGFLVDGASLGLDPSKSWLLTNAHVLWDPERGQGHENGSLAPGAADIVFEGADGHGGVLACGAIEWQSPSGLHDATLFELDRRIDDKVIKPIVIASTAKQLELDDGSGKRGTALTVVGHPEGGALSIGLAGSLEEISARLLDKGPRGTTGGPEYLHYSTPTEPGNSGSPVFETEHWQVVGLHHAGFNEKHGRPKLGGKAGSHEANEGIWLESIRKDLKDHLDQKRRGKRRGWFG